MSILVGYARTSTAEQEAGLEAQKRELVATGCAEIFAEQVDGPMDLPFMPDVWSRRFAQFVKREDCAWQYLEASAGSLTIEGEELGKYVVRFEREVLPVRWVLRHDHGNIVLSRIQA